MKIEKITPSKKHKDIYYIDFADGSTLRVGINQIADYSLFTGRELSHDEHIRLLEDTGRWNCVRRAMQLVGYRPHSRRELIDKLVAKGEAVENAEYAVDRLEALGVINDHDYAAMIVRHYAAKGYGAGRIRNELYSRGISRDFWEEALAQIPDQSEALSRIIESKLKGVSPDKKELKKLSDHLLRRGFSWEEIRSALSDCLPDEY